MSCFRQVRAVVELFVFHLRSALLHSLLMDLVYSLSHGWGFCLGILVLKGAMESRMDKHLLLKSSVISSTEQCCSGGWREAEKALQKVLADAELKTRDRKGTGEIGEGQGRGALKTTALWSDTQTSMSSRLPGARPSESTRSRIWPLLWVMSFTDWTRSNDSQRLINSAARGWEGQQMWMLKSPE